MPQLFQYCQPFSEKDSDFGILLNGGADGGGGNQHLLFNL